MFNNRFNSTKKDPLVEAVQIAMQDGEIRRQAVAYVNEAFGVYNRNAVVREDLAEYDAAIEEAYNCMKEGGIELGPVHGRSVSKTGDTTSVFRGSYGEKDGQSTSIGRKMSSTPTGDGGEKVTNDTQVIKSKTNTPSEPKKPATSDLVSEVVKKLAKKDYDKDGKIESPKDEVWGSRFRAAKMAGKMEEAAKKEYDDKEQSEHGVYKGKKKQGYVVHNKKTGTHTAYHDPQGDDDYGQVDDFPSKRKAVKQIKTSYNLGKKKMEEEQIDEISKDLATRYFKKATKDARYAPQDKAVKRFAGAELAFKKKWGGAKVAATEETQIDELTKPTAKTAHKVLNRSEDDLDKSAKAANRLYSWKMKRYPGKTKKYSGTAELPGAGNVEMHQDKYPGYVTKAGKLTKSATKDTKREIKDRLGKHAKPNLPEETQIDEISKKLALKAMKKSDERGEEEYDRDMTSDRLSDPKTHWDRAKRLRGHMKRKFGNKTIKTGGTDNLSPKSYEQGGGERRRADKLKKGPRAGMISARHRDKLKDNIKYSLGKHKKPNLPEETQIDEIKVSTAYSYAGKKMEKERKGLLPGDHNPTSKTELKNMRNAAERTDKDYYKKRGFKKMEEASDVPGDDKSWRGVEKPHDYTADEARSIRKEYEGSKGEIRKDNKYPGL